MKYGFNYKIERVPGYNCPDKFLLLINSKTICFLNTKNEKNKAVQNILEYACCFNEDLIKDRQIKRRIQEAINSFTDTEPIPYIIGGKSCMQKQPH